MTLTENQLAPAFTAVDQFNKSHSLSDYAGKWVVIYFYPEDDTPGCTKEACNFRDQYPLIQKYATLLGVSTQSTESHRHFAEKHQLPFPLLSDSSQKMVADYGADGLLFKKRVSFIIDPNGKIAKIYPKVNVNTHSAQIIKDLQNLQKIA